MYSKNIIIRNLLQFLLASLKQIRISLSNAGCANFYNIFEVVVQYYTKSGVELSSITSF